MKRFLAIGECMLELAPAEGELYRAGFAGDTFNTAWYARQLAAPGIDVAYLSAVGTDDASLRLEAFVRSAGITPEFARRADRSIGLYMIALKNGERSFSYWRSHSAARTLADDLTALPGLQAGDLAYFSGITLAILPPEGRVRLLAVLAEARRAGIRIAFDPNLRPRLWSDVATMRAAITAGAAVADIVLPSYDDEAVHFGDADPAACAARYLAGGAQSVAVKDGPNPVLVVHNGTRLHIVPPQVPQIVDSTAAGDSFNAAFLLALEAGQGAEAAARAGCGLASKVIGQRGALVDTR